MRIELWLHLQLLRLCEWQVVLSFITSAIVLITAGAVKKAPELPTYKGSYAPNRFNIRPGYRWDGVDRSSGFEKSYYSKQADRRATSDVAFKWSTEEMWKSEDTRHSRLCLGDFWGICFFDLLQCFDSCQTFKKEDPFFQNFSFLYDEFDFHDRLFG